LKKTLISGIFLFRFLLEICHNKKIGSDNLFVKKNAIKRTIHSLIGA